jgi:hypothetical protein
LEILHIERIDAQLPVARLPSKWCAISYSIETAAHRVSQSLAALQRPSLK